jgi:hypothetical protein
MGGGSKMSPLKEAAIVTIKRMPDECTAEDIMREVSFTIRVFDSLKHSQHGERISSAEMLKINKIWDNDF